MISKYFCILTGKTSRKENRYKLKVIKKTFILSSRLLPNLDGAFQVVGSYQTEQMKVNNLLVCIYNIYFKQRLKSLNYIFRVCLITGKK